MQFYGPPTTFHFMDFVEQNGEENYMELLLVKLL
jgi:hypothetical protein